MDDLSRRVLIVAPHGRDAELMCAHLEAASVIAFDVLAEELAAHGAPPELVASCRDAAIEEIAHAEAVGLLARRYGSEMPALEIEERRRTRSLLELAIDNAIEGLVRELFGAVQAHARAALASDEVVRIAMKRIAEDESRHAELSTRIGAFLDAQLDPTERSIVRSAAQNARAELRAELARNEVDPELSRIAGVPTRPQALALFDALEAEVWRAPRKAA